MKLHKVLIPLFSFALVLFSGFAQAAEYVDYFDSDKITVFEKQQGKFVSLGQKTATDLMKECSTPDSPNIAVSSRERNYAELKCAQGSVWVSGMSFTPQVDVQANCTKQVQAPVSKLPVIVIAGVRGAGAEKNACN